MPALPAGFRAELRATLPIAAPLAAANLSLMAMGLTNAIVVGHLGATALAAAGLGGGLFFTFGIVCQSVVVAVAPLAAHAIGARDDVAAGEIATGGLVLAAALAVPLIALLSMIGRFLLAIGYDPALAGEVDEFLAAIRWGVPGFLTFGVFRALLAASTRARVVMIVVIFAIPANAVLNWMLVFGHLGLPALGIAGSGWSTAIIQSAMSLALFVLLLLAPRHTPLRAGRRLARHIGGILRLGLPIGGMIALEVGLFATAGILLGLLGADALGAHQLVINFASLTFMVPLGVAQAATVRVAFELGAGAPSLARRAALVALVLGATVMAVVAVLIWAAPGMIIGIYVERGDPGNQALIAIARQLLAIAALFQVFDGVQVIAAGALRGYRETAVPMLLAAVGYWGVGFLGGWALAFPLGYGAVGLWLGLAAGLAVVALLLTLRLRFCAAAAAGRPRLASAMPQCQAAR